jgi:methyl-accepting chemotaxis protein
MKWSVGTKLAAGFSVVLLIFVIVGIVSYNSTTQLVAASDLRKHTYEVLLELRRSITLLKEVEVDQRNYVLTAQDNFLGGYQESANKIGPTLETARTLTADNARQQRRLDQLEPLFKERIAIASEAIEIRRSRGLEAAIQFITAGRGQARSDDISRLIGEMESDEFRLLEQRTLANEVNVRNAKLTIVLGTFIALVLAGLAGLIITRNIARPLGDLTGLAERIAVGDLSATLVADSRTDEVGALSRAFERMTQYLRSIAGAAEQIAAGNLRSTVTPHSDKDLLGHAFVSMSSNLRQQIRGVIEGATVLGSAASQIVASTVQLAAGATESATAVSETTTTVEEVRQTAQMANHKARTVSDSAQKAAHISLSGRKATDDMVAGMNRIRDQMEAIASSMMRLSEQGHTIGQIIATVEDLAAQSNLLAVNAAIEAAKAAEHGKGFGVVAQEIKSLAEQSRQATDKVRTILSDIQKATSAAVMATEQGAKAVAAGATHTDAAGESIQSLTGSVGEAAQAATQIAASSQQQLVGMDQVAAAMDNIKQASTQNVASAKQLETAARNLDDLGRRLKQMVERYSL